jgi:Uma2 family endonuclease
VIPDQTQSSVSAAARKMTVEEFLAFCELPENADRHFELIDGEIAEKEVAGIQSSSVAMRIGFLLTLFLEQNLGQDGELLGTLTDAQGSYALNSSTALMPDIGFISKARMPVATVSAAPTAPDLAVEVLSPSDRLRAMRLKADRYLANGTRIVWLVIPKTRQIEVYDGDADPVVLTGDDVLTGGAVLPGFSCTVADVFRRLPPNNV